MPLTDTEVKELSRILDARAYAKEGKAVMATCLSCQKKRRRPRLKVITGDALSPGAMRLARAYDAATPARRQCMDAAAAITLAMAVAS